LLPCERLRGPPEAGGHAKSSRRQLHPLRRVATSTSRTPRPDRDAQVDRIGAQVAQVLLDGSYEVVEELAPVLLDGSYEVVEELAPGADWCGVRSDSPYRYRDSNPKSTCGRCWLASVYRRLGSSVWDSVGEFWSRIGVRGANAWSISSASRSPGM
jgi:hypothetical protein